MEKQFINISNHPSDKWSEEQRRAASAFGPIVDLPFPNVPADADGEEIERMADDIAERVAEGAAVMVQGEFSLTYHLTKRLLAAGRRVVVACSERKAIEHVEPDGTAKKIAVFQFVRFRQLR